MYERLKLHEILCNIIKNPDRVHFQPTSNIKLKYPCIVYEAQAMTTRHANNYPYNILDRYRVIVIDQNPESILPKKIAQLQGARAAQPYVNDNLYHWPFDL